MRRIAAFFTLLIFLQTGCTDDGLQALHVLDLKKFRVEAPDTWQAIAGQGYDSQVGRLTDGKTVLNYDYGWYSYRFKDETSATHVRTTTTVDGRPALIVRPKKTGEGIIGLYVEVDSNNRLSLIGHDVRDESTIIRIFESIKF